MVVENRHEPDTIHAKTYIDQRYKLTVYFRQDYGELFDLREDPGEMRNLYHDSAYTSTRQKMTAELLDRLYESKDPLPVRLGQA